MNGLTGSKGVAVVVAAVCSGCVDGPTSTVVSKYLSGSYRVAYTAPDGTRLSDGADEGVLMSPTTAPRGHFAVWQWSTSTFDLAVGNRYPETPIPIDGACPVAFEARVQIPHVDESTGP